MVEELLRLVEWSQCYCPTGPVLFSDTGTLSSTFCQSLFYAKRGNKSNGNKSKGSVKPGTSLVLSYTNFWGHCTRTKYVLFHQNRPGLPRAKGIASNRTGRAKEIDVSLLSRRCSIDVPYLIRYEAYTGHIRDIYGTSSSLQQVFHMSSISQILGS